MKQYFFTFSMSNPADEEYHTNDIFFSFTDWNENTATTSKMDHTHWFMIFINGKYENLTVILLLVIIILHLENTEWQLIQGGLGIYIPMKRGFVIISCSADKIL
jgi:hypothetical protein